MIEPTQPTLAVLLCTYQGASYLELQLQSLEAQTFTNWSLIASDDGSTDATMAILRSFQDKHGPSRVRLRTGPGEGYAVHFMTVLSAAAGCAEYYAFCDQDDVWDPDKLARAVAALQAQGLGRPGLYCGRTRLIDKYGCLCGYSMHFSRAPSFRNALVQSLAGANSMVINWPAMELLAKMPPRLPVVSHDWWLYLLITGAGGEVYYDQQPALSYRQHGSNQIGAALGWQQRWKRFGAMLGGSYRRWNAINLNALGIMQAYLTPQHRILFECYRQLPSRPWWLRARAMWQMKLYRQTWAGTLGLWIAVLLGRL